MVMENFSKNKYCMSFPWGHGHTKFAAHIEDNRPWESKISTAREGKYSGKRPKTLSSKIYFLLLHLEIDTSPPAVPPCERCHMAPLGGKWGNVTKDERLFGTTMPHQPWSPTHQLEERVKGHVDLLTPLRCLDHMYTKEGLICHDPFGLIGLTNHKCQDHHWMGLTLHCPPPAGWVIRPRKQTKTCRLHSLQSCTHLNIKPSWYKWFTNIHVSGFWFSTSKSSLTGICLEILGNRVNKGGSLVLLISIL